jgi:hypothetical protein
MAVVESSIVINRGGEDVFQYIADFENYPSWNHSIIECKKISDGTIGVGTIFDTKMVYMGQKYSALLEITEYESNKKITFYVNQFGFFKWFKGIFSFNMLESSTRVTVMAETDVKTLYKPMLILLRFMGKGVWNKHLSELKKVLEMNK